VLLQKVGAVERLVGLLDPVQLGQLPLGQPLAALPERPTRSLEVARLLRVTSPPSRAGLALSSAILLTGALTLLLQRERSWS
jgi:hypothetical protein